MRYIFALLMVVLFLNENQAQSNEMENSKESKLTTRELANRDKKAMEEFRLKYIKEQIQIIDILEEEPEIVNFLYRDNIDSLVNQVYQLVNWARVYKDNLFFPNDSLKELNKIFGRKLEIFQKEQYPKMRENYVKIMSNHYSEYGISVFNKGGNSTEVVFITSDFVDEGYAKEFAERRKNLLHYFRFKKCTFAWRNSSIDVYSWEFNIQTPEDSEIIPAVEIFDLSEINK